MIKPWQRDLASVGLALILLIGMLIQPIPYVRSSPGATYNALGKVDSQVLVEIEPTSAYQVYDTTGKLRILTVSQWGGPYGQLFIGDALRTLFDGSITMEPTEFLFPEPVDSGTVEDDSRMDFISAESSAIAAALLRLGIPVTTQMRIYDVPETGASFEILKVDDLLRTFDGVEIPEFDKLDALLKKHLPGDKVEVSVERDGVLKTFTIALGENEKGQARLGINVFTEVIGPMEIKIQLDNVGGPSAGLAIALAITDKLTPGDMLLKRNIAVTGTIDAAGNVGAIGGLHQKMSAAIRDGAATMLIPIGNCEDIRNDIPEGLTVIPVSTLDEAVAVIEGKTSQLPKCPNLN